MLALPPVLPDPAFRTAIRLPRDHYVRGARLRLLGRPRGDRAGGSRSGPTSTTVVVTCAGEAVGPAPSLARAATGRSPTPPTPRAPRILREARARDCCRRPTTPRSSCATSRPTTACSGWRRERPGRRPTSPTCAGPSRPRRCRGRRAGSASGPGRRAGPTRSTWPRASSARWPPASPTAARRASGRPGFPARKTLEDFDFEHQRSVKRDVIAHLGALDFVEARENVVFLGPPGTGKTHLAIGLSIRACQAGHRVLFATAAEWVRPARRGPRRRAAPGGARPARALPADGHRRGRLHPVRGRGRQPVLPAGVVPLRAGVASSSPPTSRSAAGARCSGTRRWPRR